MLPLANSLTGQRRLLRQSLSHKRWSTTSCRSYYSRAASSFTSTLAKSQRLLGYSYNKERYHDRHSFTTNTSIGYDIDSIRHFSIDAHNNNITNNKDEIKMTTKETVASKFNTSTIQNERINQSLSSKIQELLSKTYQTPPTRDQFISVMSTCAHRSKKWGDAKKVEELLQRMEELCMDGNEEMKPDYKCYTICIDAWAGCAAKEEGSAERAEELLGKLEGMYLNSDVFDNDFNCAGYNAAMNAWAQTETSKSVYDRVRAILQRMYDVHAIKKNDNVLPDKISFTALMKALIKDRPPNFAMKCASILNDMEQDYAKSGNDRMRPDLIAYNTAIYAFGRAKQPELAERIMRRMESMAASGQNHVRPNVACYTTLMMSYSKNRNSFDKVEEIFQKMQTMEDCQPDKYTYNIYINALAFSDLPDKIEKAEDAFSKLEQANEDGSLQIDIKVFMALMLVYCRSNVIDKADRALQVMHRIEEAFGRIPNMACYAILLEACCHTDNSNEKARERAMEIFLQALQTIQSPDNHLRANLTIYTSIRVYRTLMFSCTRLITDLKEREQTLTAVFENCCNDGLLGQDLLRSLHHGLKHNHNLFYDLVGKPRGSGFVRVEDLPLEWRRKIRKIRKQHHR